MNFNWQSQWHQLPTFSRYALAIMVAVFLSFLFPNRAQFEYRYNEGQSWRYEDLIAPFDYPIRKPEAELAAERKSILENLLPFYNFYPERSERQLQYWQQQFDQQLKGLANDTLFEDVKERPAVYRRTGDRLLTQLFDRGVIEPAPVHRNAGADYPLQLLRDNVATTHNFQDFYTILAARNVLADSLRRLPLNNTDFILPLAEAALTPNIFYNDTLTSKLEQEKLGDLVPNRGMVKQGDLIVVRDGIITPEIAEKLQSLEAAYDSVSGGSFNYGVWIGYFIISLLIIGTFIWYLQIYAKKIFLQWNNLIFVLTWLVVYPYIVYLLEQFDPNSEYMIPFCIVPLVVRNFFSDRLALFTHVIVVLLASFISTVGYEFTFLEILVGIIVVLSNKDIRDWSRFFYSLFYVLVTYSVGFLALSLVKNGSLQAIDWSIFTWIFLNVFFTLLAYPLIPLLERMFGFLSSITLVEMSDMNRPLLKDLALKAPGTLQHSLQVSNLAEAAARAIGANELLVKVGSLYHDIGKMLQPAYFIENQNNRNPHDTLDAKSSAQIIIAHVPEGVKLAKKHKLPAVLTDFIRTHHGTTRTEYFYQKYIKENPEAAMGEAEFRYPGPKPRSKEEAIVMLADSLEASAKSLKNPTEQDIDELVSRIFTGKITHGQLENTNLTFRELEQIKAVFRTVLKSIHHVRIAYPEEKKG